MLCARSPLRIDFVGMTDYHAACDRFGGRILNATINKYIYATLMPREDRKVVLRAPDQGVVVEVPDSSALNAKGELGLVQHIVKAMGVERGIELTTYSEMPGGAGLGSSSTIATCVISILSAFTGHTLTNFDIAERAIQYEREALHTEYGWQDQYSPVTGGGVKYMVHWPLSDSRDIEIDVLPLSTDIIVELEKRMVVAYSGISRPAKSILDKVAQGVQQGDAQVIDALSGMSDCAEAMRRALLRSQLDEMGPLLEQTWLLHKKLHADVTNERLERLYEVAHNTGALGGRVCGAGGGGTMIFFCAQNAEYDVKQALREQGALVFDFSIDRQGLYLWGKNPCPA
ncbi:MAG: GHMP family kinase ATP-binding protein [Candidatus Zipacnadales bacterium]